MLSNAYFLAKFRFDTAENEPAKNLQNFAKKMSESQTNLRPPAPGAKKNGLTSESAPSVASSEFFDSGNSPSSAPTFALSFSKVWLLVGKF